MPTLTPIQLVHLQELCHKYRIEFLGEIDSSNWPEGHEDILNGVKEVASKRYDAYATNRALLGTDPWKIERKSHAMVLVKSADRSRGRNESTWRHACESFILSRLSSEVCCRDCRKRVWRSEIEVKRDDLSGRATALRNRQEARQPCRCPRARRSLDQLEAIGLNQIFNFRAGEEVCHDPEVAEELGKREYPDRVYGLRKTRNIELLLYDIAAQRLEPRVNTDADQIGQTSGFRFINQPMNAKGDRQLFPFLVLEAKSGSSDEWHAINMQTAFSIRTFLETQRQLYSAASAVSSWKARPMVWFFSNKGENWRLCAAYTEDAPAEPDCIGTTVYRVIDVWHGCITSRDGALQLLLLVDYLFDWARDRYREDIIGALRVVARGENDTASGIYQDTDIFSTVPLDSTRRPSQVTEDDSDLSNYISAQSSFLALDSPAGVFRHATFVESRYYCLYITRDNVKTFLQSTAQHRVQPLSRLILRHMYRSILTDPDTLDAIEEEWTGVSRSSALSYRPQAQEQFHVVMSFTAYLSSQWHQVRELSTIAITEDAWKVVGDASGFKKKLRKPFIYDYYDKSKFIPIVKRLLAGSPAQVLHAAITRTAYRIVSDLRPSNALQINIDNGSLRNIVYFIYAWLKREGALEPDEPFLRSSRKFDQQHLRKDHADPFPLVQGKLRASDEGCVLIKATCEAKGSEARLGPELCAYLTESGPVAPENEALAAIMKKALETRDVYHTTRTSIRGTKFTTLTQKWQSHHVIWNMRTLYGVYSDGFGFLDMLRQLGSGLVPITLGASRSLDESGSQLYKRNLSPWIDPRYIYRNSQSRMFILYKLFTREVNFWKGIARERERSGVSCCRLCAALGKHNICKACEYFLADDNQYEWFRNAVLGEPSFQLKDLSKEEVQKRLGTMRNGYPTLKEDITPRPYGYKNYDGNIDWANKLDFYSKLDEPFNDIGELALQWQRFCQYCRENGPYASFDLFRNRKRKRSEGSDAERTDDSSSDLEEAFSDEFSNTNR